MSSKQDLIYHLQQLELDSWDLEEKTDPFNKTENYRGFVQMPNGGFGVSSGDIVSGFCDSGPIENRTFYIPNDDHGWDVYDA